MALSRRRVIMTVADILRSKGPAVKTVRPDETVLELAEQLRAERIGAMIVSDDGSSIDGIISERDIAYGLAAHGSKLPRIAVSKLMTKVVVVCSPEDSIIEVMGVMTQRRIRHLPVKDGDQLVGIISIGDVLKHRLGEVQLEANVLRDYAIARR
jgi:CBS domain-containing protein